MSETNPARITIDCDDTYSMGRIPLFLELITGGYDVVRGDCLSHGV